MAGALVIKNFEALNKTFKQAPKELRLKLRGEYRKMADPVRMTAESLAATRIRNLAEGSPWARFRLGITQKLIYIAPRQKGSHGRGPSRRKNMGNLLAYRALGPAIEQHEQRIEHEFEQLLDRMTRSWNSGP
jgi:hypothetical protein